MVVQARKYQAYYTKSNPIVAHMVNLLELNGDEQILEPCAGDGAFLDELIKHSSNLEIDALELNIEAIQTLSNKYHFNSNIKVRETDFLNDTILDHFVSKGGYYDAIIANPPYGAWRTIEERKRLKEKFNGLYAKESYTLFLIQSINLLKEGGKLSFIIPDTWLSIHMHKQIRKYILTQTKVKEISLFPSAFFPNINFGYANLMIISLEKNSNVQECLNNTFSIYNGFKSVEELGCNNSSHISKTQLSQKQVLNNVDHSFILNHNESVLKCIQDSQYNIGDICDCVTGFYSGNDKLFLKVLNKEIRNSKNYECVNKQSIQYDCSHNDLNGLSNNKCYVPIVKGGNTKYWKDDVWFMAWTKEDVAHYIKDKKARYQNSNYYFKKGIGVPMVSSSSITADLIDKRLFDQSIVGVFPHDENYLYYLLAFFNSPSCNKLIRTINPSTNNSSNYIKKIPFIKPSPDKLSEITNNTKVIVEKIIKGDLDILALETKNNSIIRSLYGF